MPKPDPSAMTDREMLREVYDRIVGDGSDGNPGLDKRVDRLEAKAGMGQWLLLAFAGVLVAAIAERFKSLIGL